MVRVHSPAKINLHLAVGERLTDGYHELTSVFHALALADEVLVTSADSLSLTCDVDLGVSPQDNLAFRAALAMGRRFDRDPSVTIAIRKRVPHGAGLGGGSSNAAAVIAALATTWGVDPAGAECHEVARSLGADVGFFLVPTGAALMTGRGDHVACELAACAGLEVVLVRPHEPVSTAQAYAAFDRDPVPAEPSSAMLDALAACDARAVAAATYNNLAPAAISVLPVVAQVLSWVRSQPGVLGAQVSGSGSAVFALCDSADNSRSLVEAAQSRDLWSVATRLGSSGVRVLDEE